MSNMYLFQVDIDFDKEPIGTTKDGKSVYFKDIWPTTEEIAEVSNVEFGNFMTRSKVLA